jgi:hypothetical protein
MFRIAFFGDFAPGADEGADFFKQDIFAADRVVINLEGVLDTCILGRSAKISPVIVIKSENFLRIADGWQDRLLFSLINNHVLDFGQESYQKTLEFLKRQGFRVLSLEDPVAVLNGVTVHADGFTESIMDNHRQLNPQASISYIHDGLEKVTSWNDYDFNQAKNFTDRCWLTIRHQSHAVGPYFVSAKGHRYYSGLGDLTLSAIRQNSIFQGRVIYADLHDGILRVSHSDYSVDKGIIKCQDLDYFDMECSIIERTKRDNSKGLLAARLLKRVLIDGMPPSVARQCFVERNYSFWQKYKFYYSHKYWA